MVKARGRTLTIALKTGKAQWVTRPIAGSLLEDLTQHGRSVSGLDAFLTNEPGLKPVSIDPQMECQVRHAGRDLIPFVDLVLHCERGARDGLNVFRGLVLDRLLIEVDVSILVSHLPVHHNLRLDVVNTHDCELGTSPSFEEEYGVDRKIQERLRRLRKKPVQWKLDIHLQALPSSSSD
jgi:hypothetical protein